MTPVVKSSANRREATRYNINSPLRYRPQNKLSGTWKSGRVCDMSATGVRLQIPEAIAAGTTLEFEMDWTALYHGTPVYLTVMAVVVRADARGTAMRIVRHEFQEVTRRGSSAA